MNISKSPDRNTFQKEKYLERQAEKGKTPDNDEDTRAMVEYYESWDKKEDQQEADPAWRKDNLEWDLRTTDWILTKVRNSESYAQNLYAAMCNNDFIKREMWPVLKEQKWSCSWRYAGGIVAHMRQEGDYIDWYCSGIRDIGVYAPAKENEEFTEEQKARLAIVDKFVSESVVTDEIEKDLYDLGWLVVKYNDNQD
ncbi:hypothetical protein EBU71_14950 [bacterium]|nr:hypothetical protein [Candidatus Elulimicrobium humile]